MVVKSSRGGGDGEICVRQARLVVLSRGALTRKRSCAANFQADEIGKIHAQQRLVCGFDDYWFQVAD